MAANSLQTWLQGIHLDQQYLQTFLNAGITDLSKCSGLTEEKLHALGITLPGHKKRILAHLPKSHGSGGNTGGANAPPSHQGPNRLSKTSIHSSLEDPDYLNTSNTSVDDDDYSYVNVPSDGLLEQRDNEDIVPPLLPPKFKHRQNIDAKLGISQALAPLGHRKPVPSPRTSTKTENVSQQKEISSKDDGFKFRPKPKPKPRTHMRRTNSDNIKVVGVTLSESSDDAKSGSGSEYLDTQSDPGCALEHRTDSGETVADTCSVSTEEAKSSGMTNSPSETGGSAAVDRRRLSETGLPVNTVGACAHTETPIAATPQHICPTSPSSSNNMNSVFYVQSPHLSGSDKKECAHELDVTIPPATNSLLDSSNEDHQIDQQNMANQALEERMKRRGPGTHSVSSESSTESYEPIWMMGAGRRVSENMYSETPAVSSRDSVPRSPAPLPPCSSSRDSTLSFNDPPPSFKPPPLPAEPSPPLPPRPSHHEKLARPPSVDEFASFAVQRADLTTFGHLEDFKRGAPIGESSAPASPNRRLAHLSPPPRMHAAFEQPFEEGHVYESAYDAAYAQPAAVWESDDTLSDGGDFVDEEEKKLTLDRSKQIIEQAKLSLGRSMPAALDGPSGQAIPIIPVTPTRINERYGYMYKQASKRSSKLGWHKRWMAFDGNSIKYYSNNKSVISKRIIPVSTMVNVENDIKTGELHPYRFKLTTVDRVYSFATDEADDLSLWTSTVMQAIITRKEDSFREGGDMYRPDKEGFLKIDGMKGRRYLAIKKDRFCYYNTYEDYKAGTPIHTVEMKLGSVKDIGKNKLQLTTPYANYVFSCDNIEEAQGWKNAFEEAIAEGLADDSILQEVYQNHSNRYCADCGAPAPHWASINFAITLCKHCAGIHRMLTLPLSKVRSLRMDLRVWTPHLVQLMQHIGNDNANNFWEWNASEDDKIDSDADIPLRQQYILAKYQNRAFCKLHPLRSDQAAIDQALCKSVQYGDVLETMQLLFTGANVQSITNTSALQLAKTARQTLQMEFLYQNGADGSGQLPVSTSLNMAAKNAGLLPRINVVSQKGYLHKTGSNQKEFHRRWCTLEHGCMSYFENERSPVAKDSIDRREMMSVASVFDDRQEYSFELSTTKSGGRVYLFAAETEGSKSLWLLNIAKSFAPEKAVEHIIQFDRAGLVYLRDGATTSWKQTYIQLKEKILSLFDEEKKQFEDVDLRKIISMTVQGGRGCIDTLEPGNCFVIDLPGRALYIQADLKKETDMWYNILQRASMQSGHNLADQQLTADNIPVIVDKCISFVSVHGLTIEGIYRVNGQHSKVTGLLDAFSHDARSVHLKIEQYQVHDVSTTLKRFLRSLSNPVLTTDLYPKWLNTAALSDHNAKMQWYKYLLGELPRVNYYTLKKILTHLASVTSYSNENKMTQSNLTMVFGPILMMVDKDATREGGFATTGQEMAVVTDLLENHRWLFEVKEHELEHERKCFEAVEKIKQAQQQTQPSGGDMLIGIHINDNTGDVVTLKIPANMTAKEVLSYVIDKAKMDPNRNWGLFEVILQGDLERPIHVTERVLQVILRWSSWPVEFCKDSYICVKHNYVYEQVELVFDPHLSLFSELKYSEKKVFKKFCFEFSQLKLSYQKDTRANNPIASWRVEDLTVYLGVEQRRSPPTKWGFTFISSDDKVTKSKDSPHFGRSVCCNSNEERYRWIAGMLNAQHPNGLTTSPPGPAGATSDLDRPVPTPSVKNGRKVYKNAPGASVFTRTRNRSLIDRLWHKK